MTQGDTVGHNIIQKFYLWILEKICLWRTTGHSDSGEHCGPRASSLIHCCFINWKWNNLQFINKIQFYSLLYNCYHNHTLWLCSVIRDLAMLLMLSKCFSEWKGVSDYSLATSQGLKSPKIFFSVTGVKNNARSYDWCQVYMSGWMAI